MLLLRRSIPLLMLIALAGFTSGCAKKEEPAKTNVPPPPPPPTPEEIAAKIIAAAGLNDPLPAAGATYPQQAEDKLKNAMKGARAANGQTPDGQRAIQIVTSQLDQRIHALENAGAWEYVRGAILGFEALNPGSKKWESTKETAESELKKPKITIGGFMQDFVLLEFYLPITKETKREKMRVGEELHGITLVDVIGNNQGVKLRYGESGQTFDVLKKAASK